MVRFKTDRLVVCDIEEKDLNSFFKIYTNKENMKYISDGRYNWSKEELASKYAKCNENYAFGFGIFAVKLIGKDNTIGEAGLFNSFDDRQQLELGYILDAQYWNKGFGTEICKGLIRYSFEQLKVDKLIARMYAENKASVLLSEKCGMKMVENGKTSDNRNFYRYELSR